MQLWVKLMVWEMIFSVLLIRGQYLQSGVLQNGKPLSKRVDPSLFGLVESHKERVEGPGHGVASTCEESVFFERSPCSLVVYVAEG